MTYLKDKEKESFLLLVYHCRCMKMIVLLFALFYFLLYVFVTSLLKRNHKLHKKKIGDMNAALCELRGRKNVLNDKVTTNINETQILRTKMNEIFQAFVVVIKQY